MICETEQDVLNIVKDTDVSFIQFWFTDVLGILKSFAVTPSELEEGLTEGMGFDGSSIQGFARIEESDMIAKPDPTTFQFLPWRPSDKPVARMFCDILQPDGTHYEGDPRYVLKRILKKAADKGYTFYAGPELEYFYFEDNETPKFIDKGGYFDTRPLDMGGDLRRETIFALQDMGIQVEYSHHEVAPSQHEIDLRYDEGLKMADKTMTYRVVVKEAREGHAIVEVNGTEYRVEIKTPASARAQPAPAAAPLPVAPRTPSARSETVVEDGTVRAPLPGVIRKLMRKAGDVVEANEPIMMLEAMKMENEIKTPVAGTIAEIFVVEGDSVNTGDDLFRIQQ